MCHVAFVYVAVMVHTGDARVWGSNLLCISVIMQSCDSHMVCLRQVKKPCKWTTRSSLRKDGVGLQADVSDIDKTLGSLD